MKTQYLLPHICKKIGWILMIPLMFYFVWYNLEGLIWNAHDPSTYYIRVKPSWIAAHINTILIVGFSIAFMMIAFAKERVEDEYIMKIRGDSLIWAVIINYLIIIVCSLLLYNFAYLSFLTYNLFILLILYIIKFNIALFNLRKNTYHEE